jgi:outer membrane receptor protein involved in Fe transport
VKLDGVDADANYGVLLENSRIGFTAHASYIPYYKQQVTPTASRTTDVGVLLRPSKFKGRLSANYAAAGFSANIGVNYVGDYDNPLNADFPRIGSWTTTDFSAEYEFGRDSGFRASLLVQNLFDKAPPFVPLSGTESVGLILPVGFDPTNADPTGRFIGLELSKGW